MLDTAVTIVIEGLFTLVFVGVLLDYLRDRDPLSRDLVLVFGSVAGLFAVQFIGLVFGSTPQWLTAASALLILAQPLFTLRLTARLRPVSGIVVMAAAIGYVVTAGPLFLLPRPVPLGVTLAAVLVFAISEILAAGYLLDEARIRTGAARSRLVIAAAATALFAGALLTAGAGAAGGGQTGAWVARVVALLAALGYAVAFLPPRPIRRVWQGMAAYRYGLVMLGGAATYRDGPVSGGEVAKTPAESSAAVWNRFVETAREIAGAEAIAIVGSADGEPALVASTGVDTADLPASWTVEEFDALIADARPAYRRPATGLSPITRALAERAGASLASVMRLPGEPPAALVILASHRSLFGAEDRELIGLLASQANVLAERERLYSEQARLAKHLFAASQAKSDFIASMSHELRTPLSAILGFSELMRSEPLQAGGRLVPDEWIEHIHVGGQNLLALINDVLDLAKVEAGRLELDPASFDLGALVREAAAGLRPLAERKNVTLAIEGDAGQLVADRGRVRQILYNLLSNAIKFTPAGGSVTVDTARTADAVRLSVADTGIGIGPDDQRAVFEEFRQVGEHGERQGGTGLGLALSKRLAEAHHGTIELESAVGSGSRFTVTFPQAPVEARDQPGADDAAAPRARGTGDIDVLVIEDDASLVRLLRTFLESDGYVVRLAQDGATGLALARSDPPSAIILDIVLPGMDGWEVLRELKADPSLRDVPVVIVTVVDERGLGLALGAVDYFLKPVDRSALLDRLSRYTLTTKVRSQRVRVLAIDDDPAALDLVVSALAPEGFEVERAAGGREGIERATAEPFDLIVCDLLMPDVDGFAVVAALKDHAVARETPILILTAHTLTDADKARLNGHILGIVDKGDEGVAGLRRWLRRLAPPPESGAAA